MRLVGNDIHQRLELVAQFEGADANPSESRFGKAADSPEPGIWSGAISKPSAECASPERDPTPAKSTGIIVQHPSSGSFCLSAGLPS